MMICRFCEAVIGDHDKICGNCGYDPQTDTMTKSFVKKKAVVVEQKKRMLSPKVKSFVFWGMMIIVFSLGIKYQIKIGDLVWRGKNILLGNKVNKSAQALDKTNQNKPLGLRDVRAYQAPVDKSLGKNKKIEGIFYDPQGKSYVMINGQLISEQMSFGDMLIKKINSDSVEVLQDGKKKVLRVNKQTTK